MSNDFELVIVPFTHLDWKENNYAYLLRDNVNDLTIVFDPAGPKQVLAALKEHDWELDYILITHHHDDHAGGNEELKDATGAEVIAFEGNAHRIPAVDHSFGENEIIELGGFNLHTICLSGHTQSDVLYYIEELEALITGDYLFQMGCGRIYEGTPEDYHSGLMALTSLPADTKIFGCHEYAAMNSRKALALEPSNEKLQQRAKDAVANTANDIPNQGNPLQDELDTNPYLRTDNAEIRKSLKLEDATDVEVFAAIRTMPIPS
jgi:hydroxyacylglutathione hydrolase